MELVKNVAAIVGCTLSCISLLTLICKPLRQQAINFVRSKAGASDTEVKLAKIETMLQEHLEADKGKQEHVRLDREATLCLLRNSITRIYYSYLPSKKIPSHELKNIIYLSDAYDNSGGNSYISAIVEQMKSWEVLPD